MNEIPEWYNENYNHGIIYECDVYRVEPGYYVMKNGMKLSMQYYRIVSVG